MQKLSEQQVRHWINSIFAMEGPENGEHSLSPIARAVTLSLADVSYVDAYSQLECLRHNERLRKFRSFLDEVVRVMEDCGVYPWTAPNEQELVS